MFPLHKVLETDRGCASIVSSSDSQLPTAETCGLETRGCPARSFKPFTMPNASTDVGIGINLLGGSDFPESVILILG